MQVLFVSDPFLADFLASLLIHFLPFRFNLITYPHLCMAYKIPNDTQVNFAVKITGYGWYYIPVANGENSTSLSPLLAHFNNESTHPIVNNDQ